MRLCGKLFPSVQPVSGISQRYTIPYGLLAHLNETSVLDGPAECYLCYVQAPGVVEFLQWAKRVPRERIIVGGPQPTLTPEWFVPYAHKVVVGASDNLEHIFQSDPGAVPGVFSGETIPAYSLVPGFLSSVKAANGIFDFIYLTSYQCSHACDFCSIRDLNSGMPAKSPAFIAAELRTLKHYVHSDHVFLGDPNFLQNHDWQERMRAVRSVFPDLRFGFQTSSDTVVANQDHLDCGIERIQMGLEDVSALYTKAAQLDEACSVLHALGVKVSLTVIIDPEKDLDWESLIRRRLADLNPDRAHIYFRMPKKFSIYDSQYYEYTSPLLHTRSRHRVNRLKEVQTHAAK